MLAAGAGPTADRAFRPDIQGLRAIAVGAVVLYHANLPFLTGGYIGVDVFFVISGFLITAHLLNELRHHHRIRFSEFYARRARRILPASFLVLVLSVIAAMIWFPPLLMNEVRRGAIATALYVPNLLFAVDGTNYLAEATPSLFQHYWSLGIEEQFYLFWPLLLALGWRFTTSKRALLGLLGAVVGASFLYGAWLTYVSQPWAFFSLPTRAWELGVGGVLALVVERRPRLLAPGFAAVMGWVGLGGIVGAAVVFGAETPFPGWWAAIPVAATALVIWAGVTGSRFGPSWLLSVRPLVFIGTISYSLYLVHWPALIVPQAALGFDNHLPVWATLMIAAACVPLAWMLYRLVENPARSAVWLTRARPRRTLMAAGAGSLAAVAIAFGAGQYATTLPHHSIREAAATVISDPPRSTEFVPSNLTPALAAVAADQPVIYANGCHRDVPSVDPSGCLYGSPRAPRIALFGDSHAAQWFPALQRFADQHGYAVQSFTKSSCPSVDVAILQNGVPYSQCDRWRKAVIDHLNAAPPKLVVLANYGRPVLAPPGGFTTQWRQGLSRTVHALHVPVVVLADTPRFEETPAVCLSAHPDNALFCARSRAEAVPVVAAAAEEAALVGTKAVRIDLTGYLCGPDLCPVIIGNTLVYRDAHHLTATFSAELSQVLGDRLTPVLSRRG